MGNRITKPPKIADRLLSLLCKTELVDEILGDLHEYFEELEEYSKAKRHVLYWFHVLHFLRPNLTKNFSGTGKLNQYGMLKLIIKTTSRTFFKQKMSALMSLGSLVLGALCFHLIYLWIYSEINTNKFHTNVENIYVGAFKTDPISDYSPIILSEFFNFTFDQFPHVQNSMAVHVYRENEIKLVAHNTEFPGRAFVVDSTFFDFFDFKLSIGDKKSVLSDPSNIVLTKAFAKKVFGTTDPVGQIVDILSDHQGSYRVSGILEDIPATSSVHFDFLIPRHSASRWRRIPMELILVDELFDLDHFNASITKIGRSNPRFSESELGYFPFDQLYFDRSFDFILFSKYGNMDAVNTMSFISIMILLITLLSFVGLQTTQQLTSIKKMGVKQVIGATKYELFIEIIISRFYYLILASIFAYLLFELIFPFYKSILEIHVDRHFIFDITGIVMITSLVVGTSIVISALQLFKVKTIEALNDRFILLKIPKLQRVLTSIQYSITIVLLIVTAVVYTQYHFMINKETGLSTKNIISVDFFEVMNGNRQSAERQKAMKKHKYALDKMKQNPDILEVSQGKLPIGGIANVNSWKKLGQMSEYSSANNMPVDSEYGDLLDIEVVEGRFFSDSLDESGEQKAVINEAARKYWQIKNIDNAKIANFHWGGEEDPFEVIGVVKDYHYEHLSKEIKPLVLLYMNNVDESFNIKVHAEKEQESILFLEELYNEVNPRGIFTYEVLEDKIASQYKSEKRIGKVYFAFTLVALLLSTLGLFTYALHETNRRTKEVGIRKINGASATDVASLLSISFLKSILIAFVIACPIAWILMSKWLESFAYRTPLSWWMFFSAGVLSIIVAMIAVSWQILTVVRRNPVESLRYE